jgi:predicted ArsR family transcriptional regulator
MVMNLPFQKQYDEHFRKLNILNNILSIISQKPISISGLSRKLEMNRSTMRYYLYKLKEENLIVYEKQKNTQGRPTLIKINDKTEKVNFEKMEELSKQYQKEKKENPITKKILEVIKKNKNLNTLKIVEKVKKELKIEMTNEILTTIHWLMDNNFIKESYYLTSEGEKFLKEHSK